MIRTIALFYVISAMFQGGLATAQLPLRSGQSLTVTRVDEILAWVPKDIVPKKGVAWTQPQIETANTVFSKKLKERPTIFKMRVEIGDIFSQDEDLVLFSSLPNKEGYKIRLFAHYPKEWKDRLAKLQKGDKVLIEAPMNHLVYKTLWNEFTLVIGTEKGTFEK